MISQRWSWCCCAAILVSPCGGLAEDDVAIGEILQASQQYIAAVRHGDSEAVASFWTERGVYVDATGASHDARRFTSEGAESFSGDLAGEEPDDLEFESSVRMIGEEVALQEATFEPDSMADGSRTVQAFALWVKKGGEWKLDYLRESIAAVDGTNLAQHRLAQLTWLVGAWEGRHGETTVTMTTSWHPSGAFLIQVFTALAVGRSEIKLERRLAWDESQKVIRSWTFQSDGGFSSGVWRQEAGAWIYSSNGVTPAGEKTRFVSFWAPEGNEQIWVRLHEAGVDELELEGETLVLARVPQ